MKNKNILLLLERHVDKIVLTVYVLVSLFLLWTFVVSNHFGREVRIQGPEKKLSPAAIDRYVKQKIDAKISEIDRPAPPEPPVRNYISEFERMLQSPLSEVSSDVTMSSPGAGDIVIEEDRTYALPGIPPLAEVAIASMRGAAKVPTEEISPERPYKSAMSEVGDIDLVTVSAEFDVEALRNNFQQSFAGPRLKTSWKDTRLAAPVFAGMELQRRAQGDDDSWGQWETVSRTAIDPYRTLLEELPATLEESSFGVDIWKAQYETQEVQYDILQPEPYEFTVSRLEWMAPDFLEEAIEITDRQEKEAERERMEERRKLQTKPTETRRRTTTRRTPTRPADRDRDRRRDPMMGADYPGTATPQKPSSKEKDVDDIQKEFDGVLLGEKYTLQTVRDTLLVWAHDDTAEPGQTYQYRIRIGVFNPIAGKDWFTSEQADYKNKIVLWSDYSEVTDEIAVAKRIYVFPMEVIADKGTSNAAQGVQVEVAKFYLGQWRDFSFDVYPGQIIGYEVEDVDEDQPAGGGGYDEMAAMGGILEPETVDFTSNIMLVDIIREAAWGTNLRRTSRNKMLYYDEDQSLRQIVIGKNGWGSETRKIYEEIQVAIKRGVEQRGGQMPGGPMDDMMMDDMMMMEMMMQ